jgi:hypothetical protein
MGVIINGSLNVNNTGTIINATSATSISTGQYNRVNKNGGIDINTDARFGVPYPVNLIIFCSGNTGATIDSVTIGGGPAYVIVSGAFPASVDVGNVVRAHHFGGTSVSVTQGGNATLLFYINGILLEGSCVTPSFGPFNYTFTENDTILIDSSACGG